MRAGLYRITSELLDSIACIVKWEINHSVLMTHGHLQKAGLSVAQIDSGNRKEAYDKRMRSVCIIRAG